MSQFTDIFHSTHVHKHGFIFLEKLLIVALLLETGRTGSTGSTGSTLRGHTPKQGFVPANPNDFIGRLVTL